MSLTLILIIILAAIVLWAIAAFNAFILRRRRTDEAWADIDVQLKRRYDLIPNLVESVKGYATHESKVFEQVTQARAQALGAKTVAEHGRAENMLTEALKSVFAVAEAYPQLRASENFKALQDELADTENKVQAARRFYNGNIRDLNVMIEQFPSNIIARLFGFKSREFFEISEAKEREAPAVKF